MPANNYRGFLEAVVSGVFAASAGVSGKLALDLESREVVVGLCRSFSESALFAVESQIGVFPVSDLDVCGSAEVRTRTEHFVIFCNREQH